MKKKVLILITICMLTLLVFVGGCQSKSFEVNQHQALDVGDKAYSYMELMSTDYADRTFGMGKDKLVAVYLAKKLSEWGYTPQDSKIDGVAGINEYTSYVTADENANTGKGYNVVFSKKAVGESRGEIILSAQYDNLYSHKTYGTTADGSYESGASIGALLTLAELIKDKDMPFDLTIAFFDGGSLNWTGSAYFVSQMDVVRMDNILLAVDFANIVGGDYNYAYSIDKATDYGKFFDTINKVDSLGMKAVPADKRIANGMLIEDGLYSYFHTGMLSNNIFLMNKGVPTLTLMSLNWSDKSVPSRVEMKGKENVYQTPADNFGNLKNRVGEEKIKSSLNSFVSLIYNALVLEQNMLVDSLATARDQMPSHMAQNYLTNTILSIGLKILTVVAMVVVMSKFRKIVNKDRDKYMQKIANAQEKQHEEPIDVFGFDAPKNESTTNADNNKTDGTNNNDDVFDGF